MKQNTNQTEQQAHPAQYLDKQAAAALLGISPRSLDIWMSRGLVPYLKIGRTVRFVPADLHEHLTTRCRIVR